MLLKILNSLCRIRIRQPDSDNIVYRLMLNFESYLKKKIWSTFDLAL